MRERVLIAGGGITGLTAAYRLRQRAAAAGADAEILLVEREERLGGQIWTERTDGLVIEAAPDSFLARKPWFGDLCRELGLPVIGTNEQIKQTYILHRGRLEPIPPGMQLFIPTRPAAFLGSPLVSPLGKARALLEPLVPVRTDDGDESIGHFIARRFGPEVLDRIGAPLLAGVYGGDPYETSLLATFPQFRQMERERRSLLLGARRAAPARGTTGSLFQTVPDGLYAVVEKLAAACPDLRTGVSVRELAPVSRGFAVVLDSGEQVEADAVILTLPAYATAGLVAGFLPDAAAELRRIEYASVVVAALAYRRAEIDHPLDATGFLVPRSEELPITASTWVSSKWTHAAPPETALLRGYLGRPGDRDWTQEPDDAVIAAVRQSFCQVMGITAEPVLSRVFRWPRSRPRYRVGHLELVGRIEASLQRAPGLLFAGAAYRGAGLPDCVRDGAAAADRAAAHLGWGAIP
jgi:protoporphyrinogen/coproporphyrinogen III oxidase